MAIMGVITMKFMTKTHKKKKWKRTIAVKWKKAAVPLCCSDTASDKHIKRKSGKGR